MFPGVFRGIKREDWEERVEASKSKIVRFLHRQFIFHLVMLYLLRKKYPYSELFWFAFSLNVQKYGPEQLQIRTHLIGK